MVRASYQAGCRTAAHSAFLALAVTPTRIRAGLVRDEALAFTQAIGSFAFESAHRLRSPEPVDRPRLTDRQRECVLWVARGIL
jgi:hypothetical protein